MVFTKLLLENALAIRSFNYGAASEPLLPKVARCIPVLSSRCIGKCTARVLKRSDWAHARPNYEENVKHAGYFSSYCCSVHESKREKNKNSVKGLKILLKTVIRPISQRSTTSVRNRHTFSADKDVQYRSVTPSVQWRMCCTDL